MSSAVLKAVCSMPMWQLIPVAAVVAVIGLVIKLRYFHSLSKVPGPFWASTSKGWMLFHALAGRQHIVDIKSHEKYGPIYRAAPNYVIINDPSYIAQIYKWDRSDWFISFDPRVGRSSVGSARPMPRHNFQKRRISPAYSMNSILEMEADLDVVITEFISALSTKFAQTGKICDFAEWAHWFAFDAIMDLAFSDRVGFMKQGKDVNNLISSLVSLFGMAQVMATLPSLLKFINLPGVNYIFGPKSTDEKGTGALQGLSKRAVARRVSDKDPNARRDLLQRFMEYRDKEGNGIPVDELELEAFSPAVAGPDSTATALRAAILYITSSPHVYRKVMEEIVEGEDLGRFSTSATFLEVKSLPYFCAAVKEVFRIHPPVGTPFPRLVPHGGATILGYFLPEGTEIGLNTWAISYNKAVYGSDADQFRPERWLESEEQAKYYDKIDLNFGAVYCTCVGKNVALVEIHKVLLELLRNFEISVVNPLHPWESRNNLSFVQSDFNIRLSPRKSMA